MNWRYIIKQLGFPPSSLFIALLAAWLLRKRLPRLAQLLFYTTLACFYALSLPITVDVLARTIETEPALTRDNWPDLAQRADAIVILGGGREKPDNAWQFTQPSAQAMQRARYAVRLSNASQLPLLATGGAPFARPHSEAELFARALKEDFSSEIRWLENQSRTTWENAVYSSEILQAEGLNRVVLVTDAWHMPRARWSFEQVGLKVISAPISFWGSANHRPLGGWLPEARAFWQNTVLLNELIGQRLYQYSYSDKNNQLPAPTLKAKDSQEASEQP